MITGFYASVCGLLIVKLAIQVIGLRRVHLVRLGDGGINELQTAIRTHGNAIEYIPISLILMLTLELSGAPWWLIHLAGITLVSSRLLHASALKSNNIDRRVLGMKTTLYLITSLAIINMAYFIFGLIPPSN